MTRLLALVVRRRATSGDRAHIEVLLLQPSVVMVVTITSTGGVAKKLLTFSSAVDPGLAAWANEYLNERLDRRRARNASGAKQFEDVSLSAGKARLPRGAEAAFVELATPAAQSLYVGGAASLLDDVRADELEASGGCSPCSRSVRPCWS